MLSGLTILLRVALSNTVSVDLMSYLQEVTGNTEHILSHVSWDQCSDLHRWFLLFSSTQITKFPLQ